MMKTLIICAGDNLDNEKLIEYANLCDYVICADGGYTYALENSIVPNMLVGDFDSCEDPKDFHLKIKLPCEKNETDSLYALDYAISKGATQIILYGAIGTRFDHSYANICMLAQALERDIKCFITDGKTRIYLTDSSITIPKDEKKDKTVFSVYSFSDSSYNVNIKGAKYPLLNYAMSKYDVIGTSNEVLLDNAVVTVEIGRLLIIVN